MRKILYLWITAVLLTACASADIQVDLENLTQAYGENAIIEASGDITLVFSDAGSSKTILFSSTKPWSAAFEGETPDWLSFSPASGEGKDVRMQLTVAQNGYDNRQAAICITSEDKAVRFRVEQKQKDALIVTQSSFELPGAGGEIEIEVKANIDYAYSISSNAVSWVKPLNTKGLSTRILKFQVLPTDVQEDRRATISIEAANRPSETVTVTQGPKYHLEAPSVCSVADNRSEFIVRFDTNAKIVATCPDNWIRPVTTYKSDGRSLQFVAEENPGLSAREGSIVLKSDDDLIAATVKVVQEDTLFHCNGLGVYVVGDHGTALVRAYRSAIDQNVLAPNTFAFQNYALEDFFSLTYEKAFRRGISQEVTVMALGIPDVLPHKCRVKVTQVTRQAAWLYDEEAGLVYVIKPDQE